MNDFHHCTLCNYKNKFCDVRKEDKESIITFWSIQILGMIPDQKYSSNSNCYCNIGGWRRSCKIRKQTFFCDTDTTCCFYVGLINLTFKFLFMFNSNDRVIFLSILVTVDKIFSLQKPRMVLLILIKAKQKSYGLHQENIRPLFLLQSFATQSMTNGCLNIKNIIIACEYCTTRASWMLKIYKS